MLSKFPNICNGTAEYDAEIPCLFVIDQDNDIQKSLEKGDNVSNYEFTYRELLPIRHSPTQISFE